MDFKQFRNRIPRLGLKFLLLWLLTFNSSSVSIAEGQSRLENNTHFSSESDATQKDTKAGNVPKTHLSHSNSGMFIENVGQTDNNALFQVRNGNYTIWLSEDSIWVTVLEQTPSTESLLLLPEADWTLSYNPLGREESKSVKPYQGVNIKISFPGSNPNPHLEPFNRLETNISYFIGNDPTKWHTNVPAWNGVRYKNLYPGIDLEITSENGRIIPRIVARDNSTLGLVRLQVDGIIDMRLSGNRILLKTAAGDYIFPLLQTNNVPSQKRVNPIIIGNQVISPFDNLQFNATESTVRSGASDLLYATFLGGGNIDIGYDIAIDSSNAVYVTGRTDSADFPTIPGAFDTSFNGTSQVFVAKLNTSGSGIDYATFIGGSSYEEGYGIAVDANGKAYITGGTGSYDFPTTLGAFDEDFNGGYWDAFIVKLNEDGSDLEYATFLGGGSTQSGAAITIDSNGAAYVTGGTWDGFPTTTGAFDTTHNGGNTDAFLVKLNATGSALDYATFLGGNGSDSASDVVVNLDGEAFVVGTTPSSNFPTTLGAFDTSVSANDAFVVKINTSGSALDYSTFIGGSSQDWGNGIAIALNGSAYVTGATTSTDFPATLGVFDSSFNGVEDAFVVKLNATGSAVSYATYLGGSDYDYGNDITIDASGNTYTTGYTSDSGFPVTNGAFDSSFGGLGDAFLVNLNTDGSGLDYATFLGGSSTDEGHSIVINSSGLVFVTGQTVSSDFPTTPAAFDISLNGSYDAFVINLLPPFLDLPFQYTNFAEASKGSNNGGYVNSWFDHTSPGNVNALDNLTTWYGPYLGSGNTGQTNCNSPSGGFGVRCYNGHNGIDFKHVTDEVLSAAPGIVWKKGYEQNGFGNYLYIDHQNCYASFYAHLKNSPAFVKGDSITNRQVIGTMGNTGKSLGEGSGVHLHFGLYFDPTCDGDFSDRIVVDPYGWSGNGPDPWTAGQSKYLWKYPYDMSQQSITNAGGNASTPSGNLSVEIPPNAVASTITLDLLETPPVSEPSATLRSSGSSFWLRVIEWLTGTNNLSMVAAESSTNSFDVPILVSVKYNPSNAPHLDFSQSKIKQWDENTQAWVDLQENNVDMDNFIVTAQTSLPGYFDLQAPLICPADILEPNDNYDGSSIAETNGGLISNLFDIAQDEDWFKFIALGGGEYFIQTTDLATGVDTILEIYDTDGVTELISDDNSGGGNASSLTWQAPSSGIYFVRVKQAIGSAYGCSAGYQINIDAMPIINAITRASTSPTAASSVDFTVTFSEDVQNVDSTDFILDPASAPSGSSVTSVTPVSASVYTVTVNTGTSHGSLRLDVLVSADIEDLAGNPLAGLPFTSGEVYVKIASATLKSLGANDGWILETTETSTSGGTMNNTATTLWLGDDASDRQYRAILHFDTSSLPDNAVITTATLQMRKQSTSGTNPFTILGSLRVDARRPDFGLPTLELTDFRASAAKNNISTFNPTPVGPWYSAVFNSTGRLYINRTGTTQFKIYFTTGDNDDLGADIIRFYSGNKSAAYRPKLVIEYYVP